MVRLRPVWMTNHPPSVLWHCWLGHQTCKNRRPYNLYFFGADVKPCSINQSVAGSGCCRVGSICSLATWHKRPLNKVLVSFALVWGSHMHTFDWCQNQRPVLSVNKNPAHSTQLLTVVATLFYYLEFYFFQFCWFVFSTATHTSRSLICCCRETDYVRSSCL